MNSPHRVLRSWHFLASQAGIPNARASADAAKAAPKTSGLVDVNHATLDQLKTLPGIQDAIAAKIVKNRPYANKTQLSTKGVMSAATYKQKSEPHHRETVEQFCAAQQKLC